MARVYLHTRPIHYGEARYVYRNGDMWKFSRKTLHISHFFLAEVWDGSGWCLEHNIEVIMPKNERPTYGA